MTPPPPLFVECKPAVLEATRPLVLRENGLWTMPESDPRRLRCVGGRSSSYTHGRLQLPEDEESTSLEKLVANVKRL